MKIGKDHQPQTGQIATIMDITLNKPTTAPTDTNRGLYSSMSLIPEILGMMKDEKIISPNMMV